MFIDIHSHQLNSASNSVFNSIVNRNIIPTEKWFSLGIHPWYIDEVNQQFIILEIELKKNNSNFLFIGECGLDKVKGSEYSKQEEVFRKQIAFSEKYKKPLIIHCVKAFNELIKLKKELSPTQLWVVHGFNRKSSIAKSLLEEGMFISFGLSSLKSSNGKEVLEKTALNKMFFETDDDNTSSIEEVYILASEILKVDIEILKNTIKDNLWQIIG